MTVKVALQATAKKRKMGYGDFIDDGGVPMDGVELDSSSTASSTVTSRGLTSSACLSSSTQTSNTLTTTAQRPITYLTSNSSSNAVSNSNTSSDSSTERVVLQPSVCNSDVASSNAALEMSTTQNEAMTTKEDCINVGLSSFYEEYRPSTAIHSPDHGCPNEPNSQLTNPNSCNSSRNNNQQAHNQQTREANNKSDSGAINTDGQSSSMAVDINHDNNGSQKRDQDPSSLFPNREAKANVRSSSGVAGTLAASNKNTLRSFGDLFDDDDLD